ncbi:cell wall elongation regulator TseB-like domain-containing protein [Paenibacillus sp. 2TAB19]|uniref:cell wall elongation regulator TseB-like domain-containing protein n=1 Tax=Paenibacillus sp. 2TAB19 TaxID=3233003 RepID=UPI003F966726
MRADTKKRQPIMTTQRWIFVIVAVLLIIITTTAIYYKDIKSPRWSDEREAKADAIEAAELTEVDQISKHIWDQVSWFVSGKNADGEQIYVWLPRPVDEETDEETSTQEPEPIVVKASEAEAKKAIRAKFDLAKPEAVVKRMQPGLLGDKPVWEIFYTLKADETHYYYDFYSFTSGAFLNEYKLPAKTEPQ